MTGKQDVSPDERPLVLYLLPFARWGGPGSLLCIFLRHLTRYRGLVAVPPGIERSEAFREAGARLVELPGLATVPRELRPWRLAGELQHQGLGIGRILRLIRSERPVLVHSFTEGMLQGAVAARLARLPAVTSAIGMTIFHPWPVGVATTALLGSFNDRLLCAQPMIRNKFLAYGARPQRLTVLPNCIEPERVRERAGDARPLPGEPLVTMVASMDRRKGHDHLIRAAGLLAERGLAVRVRIIGSTKDDPAFAQELRELVATLRLEQRVEFVGPVDNTPAELAHATIHVVPSRIEALPLAGLEAMALGLPVVATRVGGNPFMVVHGETGLLCAPDDPEALAAALAELLGDPERAKTMGRAGRERVGRLFDARAIVPRLEQVYDELLAG